MGRDYFFVPYRLLWDVSIHAPAWGATTNRVDMVGFIPVSIHAPAWGATMDLKKFTVDVASFNPRARMGRDSRRLAGVNGL